MKKILIFVIFFLFTLNVYGGTIRPDTPDERYVEYGEKYECIVKFYGKLKNEDATANGSAVIIDSSWILTAAHVVDCTENQYIMVASKKHKIKKVFVHENFDASKNLSGGDLALCYLEEKVDLSFYPKLYNEQDELDKVCGIAGYGSTGTAITGSKKIDNKKRAGSNKISLATEDLLMCDMSKKNPTELEFLIAHGDSGGGLFINGKLAGINSFVSSSDKPDSTYGDESWHTRISTYKFWIEEKIKTYNMLGL